MNGLLNNQITQTIRDIHMNENFVYEGPLLTDKRTVLEAQEPIVYSSSTKEIKDLKDGKDLLTFTHEYDERPELLKKKDPRRGWWSNAFHVLFGDVFYRGAYYDNYIDFVNGVYGQVPPPIQFTQQLISTQFLDEAIRLNDVGIVHNPEPTLSVAGVVKTNINNFSGTDTHLGLLSNQIYANSLINGSAINTFRRETESFNKSLITPSVSKIFGLTNSTIENPRSIQDNITTDGYVAPVYIIHDKSQLFQDITRAIYAKRSRKLRKQIRDKNKEFIEQEEESGKSFTRKEKRKIKKNGTEKYVEIGKETDENVFIGDINITNLQAVLNAASSWYYDNGMISWYDKDYCLLGDSFYEGVFKLGISSQNDKKIDLKKYTKGKLSNEDLYEASISTKDEDKPISENSLIYKTNLLFKNNKINKFGVYYQSEIDEKFTTKDTTISDTSTTNKGRSIGRNLTTVYDHPLKRTFCRAWTNKARYELVSDLIKPHDDEYSTEPQKEVKIETIQDFNYRRRPSNGSMSNGGKYLADNTVLGENGFVRITPSLNGNRKNIKDCMFSIENLAWKDVIHKKEYLSDEQRGPLGGRIMWFPPYDLNFEESANVAWEGNSFIGRGEKTYTYSNTDRTGTLSFTLLIDHPSIIQNIYNKDGQILNNPIGGGTFTDADILRYFAGCAPLGPTDTPEPEPIPIPEPKPEPKFMERKLQIYVYFPNNYSGHYENLVESGKDDDTQYDSDFLEYMLFGVNAITTGTQGATGTQGTKGTQGSTGPQGATGTQGAIKTRGTTGTQGSTGPQGATGTQGILNMGYEMSPESGDGNNGISSKVLSGGTIPVCRDKHIYDDCQTGRINSLVKYYYRVDRDLNQTLKYPRNYKDSRSFGLNSYNTNNEDLKKGNFSFLELAWAMLERMGKTDTLARVEQYYGHLIRKDEIKKFFTTNSLNKITKICFRGSATKNDFTNSKRLAKRRGSTLKQLFQQSFPEIEKYEIPDPDISTDAISTDTSDLLSKRNRYSLVEIIYNVAETDDLFINIDNTEDEENNEGVLTAKTQYDTIRYETESEYFSRLKNTDNFLHKRLVDKFKYFDPAFHSISPEGFNARLTFLQQCTRQGHSMENINNTSLDPSAIIASNLSFGRPPICVLRLGDFIHTRIIIQSMSISYGDNGMQWDLNPDGIGVQPMMAKVSMQIIILGGQSLEAPLTRLQNAITFNYYANAGVYDDRADRARPSETNEYETEYYWAFEAQNTYTIDNQEKQDAITN